MPAPLVLLYAADDRLTAALRPLCLSQKIRLKSVDSATYGQSLAADAGLAPEAMAVSPVALPEPLLVMVHFSNPVLQRFLQGFARFRVPRVSLKAILTPTNQDWNAGELYAALCEERDAIGKQQAHE